MDKEEFLFKMYYEYGIISELVKRYIPESIDDYSSINRRDLAIKIESQQ